MAYSSCMRCDGSSFEAVAAEIRGAAHQLVFIQCDSCGGVVGVQELNNIGSLLAQQDNALKKIAAALNISVRL